MFHFTIQRSPVLSQVNAINSRDSRWKQLMRPNSLRWNKENLTTTRSFRQPPPATFKIGIPFQYVALFIHCVRANDLREIVCLLYLFIWVHFLKIYNEISPAKCTDDQSETDDVRIESNCVRLEDMKVSLVSTNKKVHFRFRNVLIIISISKKNLNVTLWHRILTINFLSFIFIFSQLVSGDASLTHPFVMLISTDAEQVIQWCDVIQKCNASVRRR